MVSRLFCDAKIQFVASIRDTKKSAKISLFADSFRMEMYEKVSIPVLRRVHAEIVCHIAAEIGWGRETEDVGDLHERESFVAQQP